MAIKITQGRLAMPGNVAELVAINAFVPLDITISHAVAAGALPRHHADPFDRMLIAQAQIEGMTIISRDRRLAPYHVPVLWT